MTPHTARRVLHCSFALLLLSVPVFVVTRLIDNRPLTMLGLIPIVLAAVGAIGFSLAGRALERGTR